MSRLRVAVVQMEVTDGQPDVNLDRACERIRAASAADLFLLPELWTTGYAHDTWESVARDATPRIAERLQALSAVTGAAIGGSMMSLNAGGALVNRFWLVRPNDAPAVYDKTHLFRPLGEDRYLAAGSELVSAALGDWTAGLSICYDLRFPDMFARYALGGADLILCVAEWPGERGHLLRLFAAARAAENQCYLVVCNRVGTGRDGLRFGGGSAIIGPDGSIVGEAGAHEALVEAVLDQEGVGTVRSRLPVVRDRVAGIDGSAIGTA